MLWLDGVRNLTPLVIAKEPARGTGLPIAVDRCGTARAVERSFT